MKRKGFEGMHALRSCLTVEGWYNKGLIRFVLHASLSVKRGVCWHDLPAPPPHYPPRPTILYRIVFGGVLDLGSNSKLLLDGGQLAIIDSEPVLPQVLCVLFVHLR